MPDLVLRQARENDLPALVGLLQQLFSIEADFQCEPRIQEQGLRHLLAKIAQAEHGKEQAQVLIAESAGRVIAMCSVQVLISTAEGDEVGLLEDLIVDEAYRGTGVGSALLVEMESWSRRRGLRRLQLLADHANQTALDFYTHHQWRTTQLVVRRKYL